MPAIAAGRPVAKIFPSGGPSDVYVFGARRVQGLPDTYLEARRNVGRLSGFGGIVAFGILLIRNPAAEALAVLWLFGSFALVWGVMLMLGGFEAAGCTSRGRREPPVCTRCTPEASSL
jgi:hypothetical protein